MAAMETKNRGSSQVSSNKITKQGSKQAVNQQVVFKNIQPEQRGRFKRLSRQVTHAQIAVVSFTTTIVYDKEK